VGELHDIEFLPSLGMEKMGGMVGGIGICMRDSGAMTLSNLKNDSLCRSNICSISD